MNLVNTRLVDSFRVQRANYKQNENRPCEFVTVTLNVTDIRSNCSN